MTRTQAPSDAYRLNAYGQQDPPFQVPQYAPPPPQYAGGDSKYASDDKTDRDAVDYDLGEVPYRGGQQAATSNPFGEHHDNLSEVTLRGRDSVDDHRRGEVRV